MTNSFLHVLVAILNPRSLPKVKHFKKGKSPSDSTMKILKIDVDLLLKSQVLAAILIPRWPMEKNGSHYPIHYTKIMEIEVLLKIHVLAAM